jgi:transposase
MKSNRKAGSAGRRERRTFTDEFKAEAVRLVAERRALGVTLAQVGRELDVRPDQLRAWTRQQRHASHESGAGLGMPRETLEQENRRLRRENAVLRQEQAFAKKVAAYFAKESR